MKFDLSQKAELRGDLLIELHYPDMKVKHFEDKNLIVLGAKLALLDKLCLPGLISDPITHLKVGTGGTVDPEGRFPKPIEPNRPRLFNEVASTQTSYARDNNVPFVKFLADIDQATANGLMINEAGLHTLAGSLFNIKTFPGIPKTNQFNIHFEWTIRIS